MHAYHDRYNKIVFSSLHDYYEPVKAEGFSIKYVLNGTEVYTLNQEQHVITADAYLLSNSAQTGHVEIDSRKNVKGICITIAPEIMTEAVASLLRPDAMMSDQVLGAFFLSPDFPENRYMAGETEAGNLMHQLAVAAISDNLAITDLQSELFLNLSGAIIRDQLPVFKQLQLLPAIKRSTRKMIFRHLQRGREFMDANYMQNPDVASIARQACMSEFHFFRMFKRMTGSTPHQYMLHKRLQSARDLLMDGCKVADVALSCGFADIFTFSKAFKRKFGCPPSALFRK
jgi:AraC family transcriptional regulator